jgi:para-nitrobenzyl esterase
VLRSACALLGALTLVGLAACAAAPPPSPPPPDAPVAAPPAVTDVGVLRGVADGDVVRFRGVPYAQPPVGERRWAPPEPVAPWDGERDATVPGPACAQSGSGSETSTSEDCLHLDVTAPAAPGRDRPVLVWLHGGGFTGGTATEIDPRRMVVRGDVVVVSVEFRLGVFGYLGLPGLPGAGTFGLADQQEALRFVRRNAAAFGGDPGNVTLVGHSGGGVAACGHLTSPSAEGLLDRAVLMSSGPCVAPQPAGSTGPGVPEVPFWVPLAEVERAGLDAAARLGCPGPADALACLRALPAEALLAEHLAFGAAAHGTPLLPDDPSTVLDEVSGVEVLSGHTRDEGLIGVAAAALLGVPFADRAYADVLTEAFGDRAGAVAETYPLGDFPDVSSAVAAVLTDRQFVCPQLIGADELATSVPVHAYEFADATAPPYVPHLPGVPAGAAHASELAYLFDLADKPIDVQGRPVPLTPRQLALGEEMIDVWTGFARTGEVDGPRWDPGDRRARAFGAATPTTDPWATHRCGSWVDELR